MTSTETCFGRRPPCLLNNGTQDFEDGQEGALPPSLAQSTELPFNFVPDFSSSRRAIAGGYRKGPNMLNVSPELR